MLIRFLNNWGSYLRSLRKVGMTSIRSVTLTEVEGPKTISQSYANWISKQLRLVFEVPPQGRDDKICHCPAMATMSFSNFLLIAPALQL